MGVERSSIKPKGFKCAFFLYQLNVHTFNCRHRADRRVDGWFEVWVDGWVAKVDNISLRLGGFAKVDNRLKP